MEFAVQTYTETAILARLYFQVPKETPIVSVANVDLDAPELQEEAAVVISGHSKLHGVVDTLTDIAFAACLVYLWKREAKTAAGTLALGWACTKTWPQRADVIPDFLKDLAVYHGTNDVSSTFRFTPRVKVRVAKESFELWSATATRFGGETGHCQIGCGVCAFCGGATAHSQFMQQYFRGQESIPLEITVVEKEGRGNAYVAKMWSTAPSDEVILISVASNAKLARDRLARARDRLARACDRLARDTRRSLGEIVGRISSTAIQPPRCCRRG